MSATGAIARIIVVLGVCMLFVNLIFPGANPAWGTLQTTLGTGPAFPMFQNPYDQARSASAVNTSDWVLGNGFNVTPTAHGCSASDYWKCVVNESNAIVGIPSSYFTIPAGNITSVQLSYFPAQSTRIGKFMLNIFCMTESPSLDAILQLQLMTSDGRPYWQDLSSFKCSRNQYGMGTFLYILGPSVCSGTSVTPCVDFPVGGAAMDILSGSFLEMAPVSTDISVSYISLTLYPIGSNNVCTTFDFGCSIAQGIGTLLMPIQLAINGFFFAIGSFFAAAIWAIQLVALFFLGIIQSLIFLVTLPGTGIPTFFLTIIDIGVFAMLGIMFLVILFWVRGVGTVGI